MNNILLCGFMGCGKTTVGRLLARLLDMTYLDLDEEIERLAGETVSEIFARHGESYFRDREHEAVLSIGKRENCVVATGGGAMTFARNREAIAPGDVCILLELSFEGCYARIQNSDRPLVRANDPARLREMYAARLPAYRQAAGLTVDAAAAPEQVAADAARIYKELKDQLSAGRLCKGEQRDDKR